MQHLCSMSLQDLTEKNLSNLNISNLNTQFFTSQLVVNDLPVRAQFVTAVQSTVVLMREEDGQTSPPTHTALCLSLCPPSLA